MIIEEVDYLKQWLIEKLKAISEADPNVLAKYVIALLKKDDNFNQDSFVEQLEVFLNDATIPFVRNLCEVIESREYMPIPTKKKRVFTEVKREPISDETVDTRLVELSVDPEIELEDKLSARKRRFEEDRDRRKRSGRREEENYTRRIDNYEERRDRRGGYGDYNRREERGDRIRSDERSYRVDYPKSRRHHSPPSRYSRSASPPTRRSRSRSPSRNGR
eukprot:sb/3469903/